MLKVGIYLPYAKNEIAVAATQFADWLLSCGIDVSLLSSCKIDNGIHRFWDSRVRRDKGKEIYKWAYNSTHLCWFTANNKALDNSRLVTFNSKKQKTKNIFIPNWKYTDGDFDSFLAQADSVICLNKSTYDWLNKYRPVKKLISGPRSYANLVSPNRVLVPKLKTKKSSKLKLLVFLPKAFSIDAPKSFFDLIYSLVKDRPKLEITILSETSLPVSFRNEIKEVKEELQEKVSFAAGLPYYDYELIARNHDVIYVANTRHTFGSILSLFAASGTPIIAQSIPPVNDGIIKHNTNGFLIYCSQLKRPYPIAYLELGMLHGDVNCYLDKVAKTRHIMSNSCLSLLRSRQNSFERFVYREFLGYDNSLKSA